MDKEKLNEAAEEYRNNANVTTENFYLTDIEDAFDAGAHWLMQQPLADRLTEEEKEKIIKKYNFNDEAGLATAIRTGEMANKYILMRDSLEEIFGSELFNDK